MRLPGYRARPSFMFIVPLYYNFSRMGLINNHLSLIIIYSASYLSFAILLIRIFLVSIPRDIEGLTQGAIKG
jgi:ABC-type glycerol-3-phosphate transport system permease component